MRDASSLLDLGFADDLAKLDRLAAKFRKIASSLVYRSDVYCLAQYMSTLGDSQIDVRCLAKKSIQPFETDSAQSQMKLRLFWRDVDIEVSTMASALLQTCVLLTLSLTVEITGTVAEVP